MGQLASLVAFTFLTVSSAWATTTAPTTPAPGAGSAPAGGAGATGTGGIGDYWWLILVVLVALAIWYFMRSRRNRTGL